MPRGDALSSPICPSFLFLFWVTKGGRTFLARDGQPPKSFVLQVICFSFCCVFLVVIKNSIPKLTLSVTKPLINLLQAFHFDSPFILKAVVSP